MQDSSHQLLLCFMTPPSLSNARGQPRGERSWRQVLAGRVGHLLLLDHEDTIAFSTPSGHASTWQIKATTARIDIQLCAAEMNDASASVRTRRQSMSRAATFRSGNT